MLLDFSLPCMRIDLYWSSHPWSVVRSLERNTEKRRANIFQQSMAHLPTNYRCSLLNLLRDCGFVILLTTLFFFLVCRAIFGKRSCKLPHLCRGVDKRIAVFFRPELAMGRSACHTGRLKLVEVRSHLNEGRRSGIVTERHIVVRWGTRRNAKTRTSGGMETDWLMTALFLARVCPVCVSEQSSKVCDVSCGSTEDFLLSQVNAIWSVAWHTRA